MSTQIDALHRRLPAETGRATILIVDDDDYVHATLEAALRSLKATTVRATSGQDGLALAHRHDPDLAIVDLGLPDIDGYELTRRLRREPALRHLRIVILTGHAPDQPAAVDAGADAIIRKPFRLRALLDLVRRQLETVPRA